MPFPIIIAVLIVSIISIIIFYFYKKGSQNIVSANKRMDTERNLIRSKIKSKVNSEQVKEKDRYGRNLLHQAIHYNFNDIAIELINKNEVDINEINDKGETALKLAAKLGQFNVIKALIDRNADVNIADKNNISPLWAASGNDFSDIVKLLLQYDADINHRDSIWGMTPIMRAAQSGKCESVKLLLNFNPNLSIQALNGETVIDIVKAAVDKYWEAFQEDNSQLRIMVKNLEEAMAGRTTIHTKQKKSSSF